MTSPFQRSALLYVIGMAAVLTVSGCKNHGQPMDMGVYTHNGQPLKPVEKPTTGTTGSAELAVPELAEDFDATYLITKTITFPEPELVAIQIETPFTAEVVLTGRKATKKVTIGFRKMSIAGVDIDTSQFVYRKPQIDKGKATLEISFETPITVLQKIKEFIKQKDASLAQGFPVDKPIPTTITPTITFSENGNELTGLFLIKYGDGLLKNIYSKGILIDDIGKHTITSGSNPLNRYSTGTIVAPELKKPEPENSLFNWDCAHEIEGFTKNDPSKLPTALKNPVRFELHGVYDNTNKLGLNGNLVFDPTLNANQGGYIIKDMDIHVELENQAPINEKLDNAYATPTQCYFSDGKTINMIFKIEKIKSDVFIKDPTAPKLKINLELKMFATLDESHPPVIATGKSHVTMTTNKGGTPKLANGSCDLLTHSPE